MSSILASQFEINGVISTDKSVLQNINTLCTASGCWMTYDINDGRWSVVINAAGSSIASFNDSNIIGGISVSGKGINELYNSVSIQFPHRDLRDQTDYIDFDINVAERFPNELDNKLNISLDCMNDPIQAQYIAGAELKQSRVDKVIQFRTDFSKIGLKAGDLIDVTSAMYGYTSKVFRITKIEEDDSEVLQLSITALEYDANIYDTSSLVRKERNKKTGIIPKSQNVNITNSDAGYTTNAVAQGMGVDPVALASLVLSLVNNGKFTPTVYTFSTPIGAITGNRGTTSDSFTDWFSDFGDEVNTGYTHTALYSGRYKITYFMNFGGDPGAVGEGGAANCRKRVRIRIYVNGSLKTTSGSGASTTIPKGDDPWNDLFVDGEFTVNQGDSINFRYNVKNDFVSPALGVTGTLVYLGS